VFNMRAVCVGVVLSLFALGVAVPATGQASRVLVVTATVAGTIQDGPGAGNYYIAFSTRPGVLAGPEPTGEGWTQYVLYQRGRFFFAGMRSIDLPRSSFRTTLPPEPYDRGSVSGDRKTMRVELPLALFSAQGRVQGMVAEIRQIKINVVTTDPTNRPLDALGRGPTDPLGFVTFDLERELFRRFEAPSGNAPPDYDVIEGTVTVTVP
jgi:hypothetical protein